MKNASYFISLTHFFRKCGKYYILHYAIVCPYFLDTPSQKKNRMFHASIMWNALQVLFHAFLFNPMISRYYHYFYFTEGKIDSQRNVTRLPRY